MTETAASEAFQRWPLSEMTSLEESLVVFLQITDITNLGSYGYLAKCDSFVCIYIYIPQISINCKMRSYQYRPTFLKNAFSTLLNQCHVELRQF